MSANAAVAASFSEMLGDLGGIPVTRICVDPAPGQATIEDLIRLNGQGGMYELVDATLVEKAMGWRESLIASLLCELLHQYLRRNVSQTARVFSRGRTRGLNGRSERTYGRSLLRHYALRNVRRGSGT